MAKILIIDDDPDIAERLEQTLSHFSHVCHVCTKGIDGMLRLKEEAFDLVILDWEMPAISGLEILRNYRRDGGSAMILMLTGRDKAIDKTVGLNSGADDYLTKPFDTDEFLARVKALLRRKQ